MTISILVHLYYEDTAIALYKRIKPLLAYYEQNVSVIINMPIDHPRLEQIRNVAIKKLPNCEIIKSTNVGKDIGGKLSLLYYLFQSKTQSDLLLFLHDKKSPQTLVGEKWTNQLLAILDPTKFQSIKNLFNNEDVGMVGSKDLIYSKKNKSPNEIFAGNKDLIFKIAEKYNLSSQNLTFIGGTMFWVRDKIFRSFFEKYSPLEIRSTLEFGNVLDDNNPTNTHSWERLFGWMVTSQGYKIKGV